MTDRHLRHYGAYAYGLIAYVLALAVIAYAVGFLANAVVPKSIDAGAIHAFGDPVVVNLALIGLFGLQHSLMARPWFKRQWTRLVPAPIERSTYVLFATLSLAVLMLGWRPMPDPVWVVSGLPALALWVVYLAGWAFMLAATEMIDGNHLMGLAQARAYARGREIPTLEFQAPLAYRFVRHPIMVGFLVAFWVTPQMSVGHLLFAGGMTGYILLGVFLEERDLAAAFGDRYRDYRADVPALVPRPWRHVQPDEVGGVDDSTTARERQ